MENPRPIVLELNAAEAVALEHAAADLFRRRVEVHRWLPGEPLPEDTAIGRGYAKLAAALAAHHFTAPDLPGPVL